MKILTDKNNSSFMKTKFYNNNNNNMMTIQLTMITSTPILNRIGISQFKYRPKIGLKYKKIPIYQYKMLLPMKYLLYLRNNNPNKNNNNIQK